jgi:processive 1,2-diacylglycerol beta-glucosyltransferase
VRRSSSLRAIVLYACSGSLGHRGLAENYCQLLDSLGIQATVVDVLQLDRHRTFQWYSGLYFWVLKKIPELWRWFYRHWTKVPLLDFIRLDILPKRFVATSQFLCAVAPDLVISTHPVSTGIVSKLKKQGRITCPLWIAFSDWHVQPFWIFPEAARYLVPLSRQRIELKLLGVRADVNVVGMLLRKEYYEPLPPGTIPDSSTERSKIIVVISGGKGWALESVLGHLRDVAAKVYIIAGSSCRKTQIEKFLAAGSYGREWVILGFVDPLSYLHEADLVIAKPGGLSTAEVLQLAKPLLLVSAMPGHEEENAQVLSACGIRWVKRLEELPCLINQYLMFGAPPVRSLLNEQSASPALVFDALRTAFPDFND